MLLIDFLNGIWRDRFILWSLVNKDLQLKYRRSKLGVAWAILTPLGLVLIIGGVYSILFGSDPKVFIPMLFAGLNPWLFINGTADGGTMALIGAEGYLKQTTVSAQIFPLRLALVNFINLLYSILAFFAIYIFLQPSLFNWRMLMVIPGLALLFVFGWSLSNLSAVINLNIRDYQPLQGLILQGLFYATPIIYETATLAEKGFDVIYRINPLYYLIELVRMPMQGRTLPSLEMYLIAIGITVAIFLLSVGVVMKAKSTIALKL